MDVNAKRKLFQDIHSRSMDLSSLDDKDIELALEELGKGAADESVS